MSTVCFTLAIMERYAIPESAIPTPAGEGKKKMLMLLKKGQLSDENKGKLAAIASAIKHDLSADIWIIESDNRLHLHSFILENEVKYVISFGLGPEDISLHMDAYVPYYFYALENYKLMFSDPLETMLTDVNRKKALWKTLQATFLQG